MKDKEIEQRASRKTGKAMYGGSMGTGMSDERFYLNIMRLEIERVKYMLKAYLRTRIIKIEKHLLYIVEKDQANLLSQAEMDYAWTLYEAKKEHLNQEFFSKVSKKLNCMEEGQDI